MAPISTCVFYPACVSFLNDGNSQNFYDWVEKLYEKVLVAGDVWEQTKMMKHGPTSMIVIPINLELPGGKDVVRGMIQVSHISENKVAGWSTMQWRAIISERGEIEDSGRSIPASL